MKCIKKTMAVIFALMLCFSLLSTSAFSVGTDAVQIDRDSKAAQSNSPVLTFSSDAPFTLATANSTKNWNGILEYSTDQVVWRVWDGTTTLSSGLHNNREKLFLRGSGNRKISTCIGEGWVLTGTESPMPYAMEQNDRWQLNGPNISCSGNIEYLLHYATVDAGGHPPMDDYCFAALFFECTALVSAPSLPATALKKSCYAWMFYGCTGLMFAPALPATTMAPFCYNWMFAHCTSLRTAPALPATTMALGCYCYMFSHCTALKNAPELPATTMADYCYACMFQNCSALTSAPVLPAMTLAANCYDSMFCNCSALKCAPKLPAMTLAPSCYTMMFSGCSSLLEPPALPATELAEDCYSWMFQSCTSLYMVPALPSTELPNCCYLRMFNGCSKIRLSAVETNAYSIPYRIPYYEDEVSEGQYSLAMMFAQTGGTFTGTPEADTTYYLHNANGIVW